MNAKLAKSLSLILFSLFYTTTVMGANWGLLLETDFLTGNKNQDALSEAQANTYDLGNLAEGESGNAISKQFFRKYYSGEFFIFASINKTHYFGSSIGYQSYTESKQSFQIKDSKDIEQRKDSLSMQLSAIPIFLNYYYKKPIKKIFLRFGGGLGVFGIQYSTSFSNGKDKYKLALESGGVVGLRMEAGLGYEISRLFSATFLLGNLLTSNLDPFVLKGTKNSSSFQGTWKKKSNGSMVISSNTSSSKIAGLNLSAVYIKLGFSYHPF